MGAILKVESKKKKETRDAEFVGTYVPTKVASYLSLYCSTVGVTKTEIIKNLFTQWVEDTSNKMPEKKLIGELAEKVLAIWETPVAGKRRVKFEIFCDNLQMELIKKGLSAEIVSAIIKKVGNEKEKKQQS